jgi:hypothetical protein
MQARERANWRSFTPSGEKRSWYPEGVQMELWTRFMQDFLKGGRNLSSIDKSLI